jgi:pimeloyl-ACP methyl ester carboxylesterase
VPVFDGLTTGAGWDIDLGAVQAPTPLWYGGANEICPVAYGQWYAERIANAELVVFPDEGHLAAADSHWPEVLAGLVKACPAGDRQAR